MRRAMGALLRSPIRRRVGQTMFKRILASMVALVALSSNAELRVVDLKAPGDGLLTQDSRTGLEWLDWGQSVGMSISQAEKLWDGFRVASQGDYLSLLDSFGLSNTSEYGQSLEAAKMFVSYVNTDLTSCSPGAYHRMLQFACGIYRAEDGSTALVNVGWVNARGGYAGDLFGTQASEYASAGYGSLLVRDTVVASIPEPSSVMLYGAGLVAVLSAMGLRSARVRGRHPWMKPMPWAR